MEKQKVDLLYSLLSELQGHAPCNGKSCVGYQNCEYGINGCYGGECAIEVVTQGMKYESK